MDHHVEVVGALSEQRFPSLCGRCGATPPAGALDVVRMFRRVHSDHPTEYVFGQVRVPFCSDCLAAHARDRQPVDPKVLRSLRLRWALRVLPYVVPLGVCGFLLVQVGPRALSPVPALLAHPLQWRTQWPGLLGLGIVLFLGFCFYGFLRMSVDAGRPLIADGDGRLDPNAVYVEIIPGMLGSRFVIPVAPTPTLAAVTFADEQYMLFESNKRTFTFTNATVAAQFTELNADRVWTPSAPRAVGGARTRYAATVAIIVIGGAYIAWELLLG